jgi:cyclic pyranopterin phosphate synthase
VVVGFITPVSRPFCDTCNRLRLDSRGQLLACLRGGAGVDLAAPLRAGRHGELRDRVRRLLGSKCDPATRWPRRSMAAIGG